MTNEELIAYATENLVENQNGDITAAVMVDVLSYMIENLNLKAETIEPGKFLAENHHGVPAFRAIERADLRTVELEAWSFTGTSAISKALIQAYDVIIGDTSGDDCNLVLPIAANSMQKAFYVKNSGSNTLTVTVAEDDVTIDDSASISISSNNCILMTYCTSLDKYIILGGWI